MIFDLHMETFIILYCIISAISFLIYKIKKKHVYRFVFWAIIECYVLLLIKVTMLPIPIYSKQYLEEFQKFCSGRYGYIQLIPFGTISTILKSHIWRNIILQLLGNVLLLLPLPILLGVSKERDNLSYWKLFLSGFLVSLFIELAQLGIDYLVNYPNKVCDIDDIILNSLGVLSGMGILFLTTKCKRFYAYLRNEWVFIYKEER